ncbi:MAG TPA: class II aldolase/adducin family protein [Ilumatobacteraceae bacterium]|jgi:ribulose-5-phosphate 4-epimerase/fuculose-1-phosphate aldolase
MTVELAPTSRRHIDVVGSLTPRDELVLLARTLWRQGYADQLGGHITYRLDDGSMLVNPWELAWDELMPEDVLRIDLDGNLLEGRWSVPGGIPLHLALHQQRHDVKISVHNHPRWGTVWADLGRVPSIYDQSGAFVGGDVAFFDRYSTVATVAEATDAIGALGDCKMAFLAHHGVLIVATSIHQAYLRAVTLEWRCRQAYLIETAGGARPMPPEAAEFTGLSDGRDRYPNMLWLAAARRELRLDHDLCDAVGAHAGEER